MAKTPKLSGPKRIWLAKFLDASNPKIFLNRTQAALAAGYTTRAAGQAGHRNYLELREYIEQWLSDNGLSDDALFSKLLSLLQAKESKIIAVKGQPTTQVEGVEVMATTEEGAVLSVPANAPEVQRKALDMALKMRGKYAPQTIGLSGIDALYEAITTKSRQTSLVPQIRMNDREGDDDAETE